MPQARGRLGNAVLARRDADGTVSGVSVDLARALAEQLGVPLALVPYDSAGAVAGSAGGGAWDICPNGCAVSRDGSGVAGTGAEEAEGETRNGEVLTAHPRRAIDAPPYSAATRGGG